MRMALSPSSRGRGGPGCPAASPCSAPHDPIMGQWERVIVCVVSQRPNYTDPVWSASACCFVFLFNSVREFINASSHHTAAAARLKSAK